MISYLLFFPHFLTRGHVTSAVRQPHILLFIYVNRPRSILGRPVVSSFDDLKFLFCPFPIWSTLGQFPTFASDFTRSNSWEFVPLALCVGVLCCRVTNVDVCHWIEENTNWLIYVTFCHTVPDQFSSEAVSCHQNEMWPFVWIPFSCLNCSWPHNCSLCTYTQNPISTLQDKQQMQNLLCRRIVIQVNLNPGRDFNSSVAHRWKMYTFPGPVCVPVGNGLVGFMPWLTSFTPSFMLTQPRTETTGADWGLFD